MKQHPHRFFFFYLSKIHTKILIRAQFEKLKLVFLGGRGRGWFIPLFNSYVLVLAILKRNKENQGNTQMWCKIVVSRKKTFYSHKTLGFLSVLSLREKKNCNENIIASYDIGFITYQICCLFCLKWYLRLIRITQTELNIITRSLLFSGLDSNI